VDPYLVLGVPPGASPAELRAAYRRLALVHHPDHGGSTERMALVSSAYEAARAGRRGGHNDEASDGQACAGRTTAPAASPHSSRAPAPGPARHAPRHLMRSLAALAETPVLGWLALLLGASVLVRITAVVLGPPIDSSAFLQLWAAVTVAWLTHGELGSVRR
jgi:DnaJ domain